MHAESMSPGHTNFLLTVADQTRSEFPGKPPLHVFRIGGHTPRNGSIPQYLHHATHTHPTTLVPCKSAVKTPTRSPAPDLPLGRDRQPRLVTRRLRTRSNTRMGRPDARVLPRFRVFYLPRFSGNATRVNGELGRGGCGASKSQRKAASRTSGCGCYESAVFLRLYAWRERLQMRRNWWCCFRCSAGGH